MINGPRHFAQSDAEAPSTSLVPSSVRAPIKTLPTRPTGALEWTPAGPSEISSYEVPGDRVIGLYRAYNHRQLFRYFGGSQPAERTAGWV